MSCMFVFILILLLLAAVFGILGIVLKTALVITLAILLTIAFLSLFAYYWFRYRVDRFRRELGVDPGPRCLSLIRSLSPEVTFPGSW